MGRPMSRKRKKRLNIEAARMILEGEKEDEIMKETGLSMFDIKGMKGWLRSERGRQWAVKTGLVKAPPSSHVPSTPSQPSTELRGSLEGKEAESSLERSLRSSTPEPSETSIEKAGSTIEKELWLQATPVVRKVILNPKIYLLYDYARSELGFEGDLGDFCSDCVEDFFNRRNIKVKIVREKEVE